MPNVADRAAKSGRSPSDIAAFATESTWDELADAPIEKYAGVAPRLVLRNALVDHERFERSGAIARCMFALRGHETPISHGRTKGRHCVDGCRAQHPSAGAEC